MSNTPAPDASRCPLCGQPNQCAMEVQAATGVVQPSCWCMEASFSQELLDRVPDAARRKACVCRSCAASAASGS